jgi:hypothetical protein
MKQCVFVCELQFRKIRYCLFQLQRVNIEFFAAHLKPCGGTPVAEHCIKPNLEPRLAVSFQVSQHTTVNTKRPSVNRRPAREKRSSKPARSVNPRWTNLILCGINGDTGTRPWKIKVNKQ